MKVSVFKDLYKSKDVPYIVEIEKIIQRIKVGKSKDTIDKIRLSKSKEEKTRLKNSLPSILFSGIFSERNADSLIEHSGLMIVDFDKHPDHKTTLQQKEDLKQNPHFVLLFISPSFGLKGVVRIPKADKISHPKIFKAFHKEFQYEYFDIHNCNVDRVCFESYDPDIYVNLDATVYDPVLVDDGFSVSDKVPLIPVTDEDKIVEK